MRPGLGDSVKFHIQPAECVLCWLVPGNSFVVFGKELVRKLPALEADVRTSQQEDGEVVLRCEFVSVLKCGQCVDRKIQAQAQTAEVQQDSNIVGTFSLRSHQEAEGFFVPVLQLRS